MSRAISLQGCHRTLGFAHRDLLPKDVHKTAWTNSARLSGVSQTAGRIDIRRHASGEWRSIRCKETTKLLSA